MIKLNEESWFYINGASSNYGYSAVFDKKLDARGLSKLHSAKAELSKVLN